MPTIRDTAALRYSEPVDTRRRRRRSSPTNQRRATTVRQVVVDPQVMAAVQAVRRPGQRVVIISATEVRLVNG